MDNNNLNIKLYLPQGEGLSDLKVQVFQEELNEINKNFPLEENQISVNKTYIFDHKDSLEVGFFIRSTAKTDISLEEIYLGMENENKEIVVSEGFNFKDVGVISPYCGIPFTVYFNKKEHCQFNNVEDYSIKFLGSNELSGFLSVKCEVENLSDNISFEEEKEILHFTSSLQTLKVNEILFSLFKLNSEESGKIVIDILVRNGYNKEVKIERLPITIVYDNNIIIARKIFENLDGIVKVSPHKAKLVRLAIEPSDISADDYDISKCRVLFQ